MKKKNSQTKSYKIDASHQSLGRLASRVASLVMGKNLPDFERNKIAPTKVIVLNIDRIKISEKKLDKNITYKYTGYPGGFKQKKWRELFDKSPKSLFMKVVRNMIPDNKLKKHLLKKINFE